MKEVKRKDLMKKLKKLGLEEVRHTGGSHAVYRLGDKQAVIPKHKTVAPGTLRDILKNLDLYKTPEGRKIA